MEREAEQQMEWKKRRNLLLSVGAHSESEGAVAAHPAAERVAAALYVDSAGGAPARALSGSARHQILQRIGQSHPEHVAHVRIPGARGQRRESAHVPVAFEGVWSAV